MKPGLNRRENPAHARRGAGFRDLIRLHGGGCELFFAERTFHEQFASRPNF